MPGAVRVKDPTGSGGTWNYLNILFNFIRGAATEIYTFL